jgi:hypothetical protein
MDQVQAVANRSNEQKRTPGRDPGPSDWRINAKESDCKCANYEEDCFSNCLQVESVNFVLHFLET